MRLMDDDDGDGGVDAFAGANGMNWMRMAGQGAEVEKGTSMGFSASLCPYLCLLQGRSLV